MLDEISEYMCHISASRKAKVAWLIKYNKLKGKSTELILL